MRVTSRPSLMPQAILRKHRIFGVLGLCCVVFFLLQLTLSRLQQSSITKPDVIPRKIWQSWKVDALHFDERDLDRARTWVVKNPNYRYELLTDNNAIPYVEQAFGPKKLNRPDIIATYKALNQNLKIVQADLLRYIIMYVDGGIWADIDVEDVQPVRTWVTRAWDPLDVDMVIGIETDEPALLHHPILGSKAQSFCQWTFMCKPGLPVMLQLIERILKWLHGLAEDQGKSISELHLDFDEVLSGTGPSAFTEAILAEMSRSIGYPVGWGDFHDLADSQLLGGVLVLPAEAFAAGTGHSRSGNHGGSRALVKHHFHASSWTSKHQRKRHPVYDEVERCNWNIECVELWDINVAFYNSLPEDEQLKMIELKRLDDARKAADARKAKEEAFQIPASGGTESQEDAKDIEQVEGSTSEADGSSTEEQNYVAPHPLVGLAADDAAINEGDADLEQTAPRIDLRAISEMVKEKENADKGA